jgi:hypothetical protein
MFDELTQRGVGRVRSDDVRSPPCPSLHPAIRDDTRRDLHAHQGAGAGRVRHGGHRAQYRPCPLDPAPLEEVSTWAERYRPRLTGPRSPETESRPGRNSTRQRAPSAEPARPTSGRHVHRCAPSPRGRDGHDPAREHPLGKPLVTARIRDRRRPHVEISGTARRNMLGRVGDRQHVSTRRGRRRPSCDAAPPPPRPRPSRESRLAPFRHRDASRSRSFSAGGASAHRGRDVDHVGPGAVRLAAGDSATALVAAHRARAALDHRSLHGARLSCERYEQARPPQELCDHSMTTYAFRRSCSDHCRLPACGFVVGTTGFEPATP